ncbi:MAG: TIGR02281 family clan AA aspartic protease, partial [Nitrosomonas sp.]|nr:TIGR02281 family clan AA aspartic protease [Nitrosomonas sp.]
MNSRTSWGVITVLVIWVVIFSVVYVFFDSQQKPKIATGKDGGMFGQIVIPRSLDGHYYVRGSINGHPIDFMVDTGASVV